MKRQTFTIVILAVLLITAISLPGCSAVQGDGKTLFITGTYGALYRGVYDGSLTVADLKRHGDFGAGTFSGIDGELVALNGKYYQIGAQGKINPVEDTWTTPNATVTFFRPDKVISINEPLSYQGFQEYVNSQLPTPNIFYAMKVTGKFDSLKARSLTKLTRPYPATPYATITQNEPTFEFTNVDSTLVVFVSPSYAGELSYPGYHAHFINSDGKYGGHVLDCRITGGRVEVASLPNFTVNLPQNSEFYKADYTKSYLVSQAAVPSAAAAQAQKVVQAKLDMLDNDMSKAVANLAAVPLNGPEARQILNDLYSRHPGIIDLVATDAAGTMVTFVPDSYQKYEGRFVGNDEKMKNFNRDKKPVLSPMFRTVEGVDAMVIMWPVSSEKGVFTGSLSALFRPDQLFPREFAQVAKETGVEFILLQSDGLILYNSDGTETGKNLFTDPLYQPSAELIALGRTIVAQESGSGPYTFISHETGQQVKKQAAWVSAGLHGTNWRLLALTVGGR
jgi:acetolactate decarboxylase